MVRRMVILVTGLVSVLCAATPAPAQVKVAARTVRFGPIAGVNVFTLGGSDATGAKSRTTFFAGGALTIPIGASAFFEPEVLYAGKGATMSAFDSTVGTVTAEFKLAYVEIPLLLGLEMGTKGGVRPRLFAGPAVGLKASCNIGATAAGMSFSFSCQDFGVSIKSVDFGVTGGAGLMFPLGRGGILLQGRYTLGLTKIMEGSDTKNQGFSIGASFMIPIGGR